MTISERNWNIRFVFENQSTFVLLRSISLDDRKFSSNENASRLRKKHHGRPLNFGIENRAKQSKKWTARRL